MFFKRFISVWASILFGAVAVAGFSNPGWSEEGADCPTQATSNFGGEDIGFARGRDGNSESDCAQAEARDDRANARRRLRPDENEGESNEPMANTGDTEIIAGRHSRMSAGIHPGIEDEPTRTTGSPVASYKDAPVNDEEPEEGADPDADSDTDEDSDNDSDG